MTTAQSEAAGKDQKAADAPATLEEIEARLTELRADLENVRGTTAEVYTRIVGYYRPVRNWNHGKSQEYTERVVFDNPEASGTGAGNAAGAAAGNAEENAAETTVDTVETSASPKSQARKQDSIPGELGLTAGPDEAVRYTLFYRTTCPNCPPVEAYLKEDLPLSMEGRTVNVDAEGGDVEAMTYQVYSAPTVIFFNNDGAEIFRAHNASALEKFFDPINAEPAAANA